MSIKAKILSLVAAFALMAAAITALGLATMSDYHRVIEGYTRASDNAYRAERLNLLIADTVIELRNVYVSKTPEELERRIGRLNGFMAQTDALMAGWQAELKPGEVPDFPYMAGGAKSVNSFCRAIIPVARARGVAAAEAMGMDPKSIAGREEFQARIDAIAAGIQAQMAQRQAELKAYQQARTTQFFIVAGSGTVLLLLASLWIAIGSITNPLKRISESVIRISEGAYDTSIPQLTTDNEISRVWAAIGVLRDRAVELKRINDAKLELHLD